jgi:hypothetical protein
MDDIALAACPAVLANDPGYLANDNRACAGSGVLVSVVPIITIQTERPSVR